MSCYEFVGPPCTKGEKFFLVYSRKKNFFLYTGLVYETHSNS